ncbi:sensor histidine kinase [Siculibacillus lacustris]|uniref:histidine kinase n=1 Tax=Siculibacillus lacustris TaxID=1549641 RepID=A0A4Q9VZK0_9HYPH|nr:GAF domain-containing sensor histidine kinase [Siculibacillus lacustris]TBW40864.1 sensor histidine kinase [Siculibacillus lacustris]
MTTPERTIDMAQILSILRAVAGQLDFRAVIHAASSAIRDLLPHDHLDVALLSPDRTVLTAYETGLHTEWDAATTATKPVEASPIRDLFTGEVDHILTDDAQNDPRFHFEGAFSKPIFAAGLRSRLHVPLKVEGRVIGALSFSTQAIASYGPAEVDCAQIVADILSSYIYALQQSELAKQSELQQVEAEARAEGLRIGALHLTEELEYARQAVGMDLHDQTLADLTRISRNLKRLVAKASLRGGELQPLQEDIDHCLRELRVIIDNAKPSVLQFFGFGQAVEALLERTVGSAATPLTWRLIDDGTCGLDELPPATVVALYRIVQEAINNTLRHAGASRIEVRLTTEDDRARIVVEDDGQGLAKVGGRRTGGLANMRTRASLIQADLVTGPGSGGVGTRLELVLPPRPLPPEPRKCTER